MLTLTSSTISPVQTGFGGSVAEQLINGSGLLTDALSIMRDTPAARGPAVRTNLLTLTFSAQLLGLVGGTPQLSGSTDLG